MSVMRIIIPAAAIIAIGGGIGLADWWMRSGKILMDRPEPPKLNPTKPADVKPAEHAPDVKPDDASAPQITPPTKPTTEKPATAELPKGHITIEQAKGLYDQAQPAFFVDARRKEVYVEGHVTGAFRADMASFSSGDPQWLGGLPKEMQFVVYCNGGDCDESEHVAQLLSASGFNAVYVMHDGFPGWKAAGHPVETGEGME